MPKRLTERQRLHFAEEGYLVVPDLFGPRELDPLRAEIADIVGKVAGELAAEGKIADIRGGESFETRLTGLLADAPQEANRFWGALEGKGGGGNTGPALFGLLTHPVLLDAMEDLLDTPEIVASSVYRIRPKVPRLGRGVVPWHQDSGYIAERCDEELIVTVWIPLVDANFENGCLSVLPKVHRGRVARHHTGGNANFLVILDEDLPSAPEDAVPVPVPLGGALLMTNRTPHCSTPNNTDRIRWSVDLRYQARTVPNNLAADIDALDPNAPEVTIACYAPEGDFVVRSEDHPASVASYAEFVRRRVAFESAPIAGPRRGWQPAPKP